MSDVVPGTLVHMRTLRRFSHYTVGELIAVPMDAAQELAAKRLALPLQLFVPTPVTPEGGDPGAVRQPAGVVRK
jgi:hypothetical protein